MAKEPRKLDEQQRLERVMASMGLAIGRLGSLPADVKAKLAKFCNQAGEVSGGAKQVLDEYWDSQKATVDEPDVITAGMDVQASVVTVSTSDGTLVKDWNQEDEKKYASAANVDDPTEIEE